MWYEFLGLGLGVLLVIVVLYYINKSGKGLQDINIAKRIIDGLNKRLKK